MEVALHTNWKGLELVLRKSLKGRMVPERHTSWMEQALHTN